MLGAAGLLRSPVGDTVRPVPPPRGAGPSLQGVTEHTRVLPASVARRTWLEQWLGHRPSRLRGSGFLGPEGLQAAGPSPCANSSAAAVSASTCPAHFSVFHVVAPRTDSSLPSTRRPPASDGDMVSPGSWSRGCQVHGHPQILRRVDIRVSGVALWVRPPRLPHRPSGEESACLIPMGAQGQLCPPVSPGLRPPPTPAGDGCCHRDR